MCIVYAMLVCICVSLIRMFVVCDVFIEFHCKYVHYCILSLFTLGVYLNHIYMGKLINQLFQTQLGQTDQQQLYSGQFCIRSETLQFL